MPNYRNAFALLLPLAFLSACTHYYYVPNTIQTPYLREQHDTKVSIGLITGNEFTGYEGHAVYSPIKYGAVMVNHFQVQSSQSRSSTDHWGSGRLTEMALGGYYPLTDIVSANLFAGWGAGRALNSYDLGAQSDLRFHRSYLQPSIVVQAVGARLGLAMRFNQLQYVRGDVDFQIGEPHIGTIERIEMASPMQFREISVTLGLGVRPIWVNGHITINHNPQAEQFGFARTTIGASLLYELDDFWRPKPKLLVD